MVLESEPVLPAQALEQALGLVLAFVPDLETDLAAASGLTVEGFLKPDHPVLTSFR